MLPTVEQETPPATLKPVTKDSLTQRVAVILKRYILTENLQEGDRMPSERNLAATLGVSHRVVREAEASLVAQGIIAKEHGRGSFVLAFNREQVAAEAALPPQSSPNPNDLYTARITLEIGIMPLVAARATDAELDGLQALVDQMRRRYDAGGTVTAEDLQFHLFLLHSTHNDWLQRLDYLIRESMQYYVYSKPRLLTRQDEISRTLRTHQAIVDALRARDGVRATAAMYNHLIRYMQETLTRPAAPPTA